MIQTNIKNIIETTGIDISQSSNFGQLEQLILSVTSEYEGWTYDFSTNILTITTSQPITGDLSLLGGVI